MKETEEDTDGKLYHVFGLEESILSKWQGNLQIATTQGNLQI